MNNITKIVAATLLGINMKMKLLVHITCIVLFAFASQSQAQINSTNLIPNNSGGEFYLPPPPPQTETTPNPPKLYIQWATSDSIKLKWQDKSYVEEEFRVELLTDQGLWTVIDTYASLAGKGLTESIVIPDLFPNEEYCFRVVAHNESGDSEGLAEPVQEACTYTTIATERSCPGSVIDDILDLATNENSEISLACDFKLQPGQLVTKRLIFKGPAASDITVDLNRALLKSLDGISYRGKDRIEVRSVETGEKEEDNEDISIYAPPENITIKNGNIIGSVRIWGMSKNASGEQFKLSSRTSDHTARARFNAPRNIVFDNLTITGTGRNPVYFAAGVSHSKLINSRVHGKSDAVAIYLDAESSKNTIKNNEIDVSTKNHIFESSDRPLIAIDGSSGNKIINNRFSNLSHGGIYLYRNCGEKSVIRHATPERNHIINNTFYYKKYTGINPSVYLGSHDRGWINRQSWLHSKLFCSDDDGYPYGSSESDKDYARNNIVMQNQFFERNVHRTTDGINIQLEKAEITPDYVKTSNPSLNSDNKITYNQIVTEETVDYEQPAGCYVEMENIGFIFDQESFVIHPTQCTSTRYTCNDGELIKQPILTPICAAYPIKAVMTKPSFNVFFGK